jgi:hypothetical protein
MLYRVKETRLEDIYQQIRCLRLTAAIMDKGGRLLLQSRQN